MPHCDEDGCCYLCRHMITCTCFDYQQGHLCKHSHKVYTVYQQRQNFTNATAEVTEDHAISNPPSPSREPLHIGVIPPKANREQTGNKFKMYIKGICEHS